MCGTNLNLNDFYSCPNYLCETCHPSWTQWEFPKTTTTATTTYTIAYQPKHRKPGPAQ